MDELGITDRAVETDGGGCEGLDEVVALLDERGEVSEDRGSRGDIDGTDDAIEVFGDEEAGELANAFAGAPEEAFQPDKAGALEQTIGHRVYEPIAIADVSEDRAAHSARFRSECESGFEALRPGIEGRTEVGEDVWTAAKRGLLFRLAAEEEDREVNEFQGPDPLGEL
jgi:hypothetical protein